MALDEISQYINQPFFIYGRQDGADASGECDVRQGYRQDDHRLAGLKGYGILLQDLQAHAVRRGRHQGRQRRAGIDLLPLLDLDFAEDTGKWGVQFGPSQVGIDLRQLL